MGRLKYIYRFIKEYNAAHELDHLQLTAPTNRSRTEVAVLCEIWLTISQEIDTLSERWAATEESLAEPSQTSNPGKAQINRQSKAGELSGIRHRIENLRERRHALGPTLPTLRATDATSVVAKLAVAATAVHPDDDQEVHLLIVSALQDLHRLKCPGCGIALLA